jgi:hypothetical protein
LKDGNSNLTIENLRALFRGLFIDFNFNLFSSGKISSDDTSQVVDF